MLLCQQRGDCTGLPLAYPGGLAACLIVLLVWPATAHAIPFVLVMTGGSLLPLLGLLLAAMLRNRRWLLGLSLLLVGILALFPADERIAQQDYMNTGGRIRSTVAGEMHIVKTLGMKRADESQSISTEELRQTPPAARVWVKTLDQPLAPGVTLEQISQNPAAYSADTVFVSFDSGWRSSLAAGITGAHWLREGMAALSMHALSTWDGAVHDAIPDCTRTENPCVRIGIHLSYQAIWSSFGRFAVDANLRIEDFLLDPEGARARVVALTGHGRIPAVMVFFGSAGEAENRQWMAFLQDVGLQNLQMLRDYDEIYADLEKTERQQRKMHLLVGHYRPELLPLELSRLCDRDDDILLITSYTHGWNRLTDYPDGISDKCTRFNLPVEGLLPDEVVNYARNNAERLNPLRDKRLVGLYLDGPGLFFATQLRDILSAQGYAWSGITFGYNAKDEALTPLHNLYDDVLIPAYRAWPGVGSQIPVHTLAAAAFLLLLLPLAGFVLFLRRAVSIVCFLGFVFLAGLVQQAFYRYPLTAWQEPLWVVAAALALALVLAQIRHWRESRPLTKARGLADLHRAGLRTPPSLVLTENTQAGWSRAVQKLAYPLIFRSNERQFENRTTASMGEYESVVVRSAADWPQLAAAWARMAATPGARPAWLVQAYLPFSASGVIRTGLVHQGQAFVRIESSTAPEAVTGNANGAIQSCFLSVEACRVSAEPLLQQTAHLVDAMEHAPALLEFGVINSQPVWLQCQRLPTDGVLRYGDAEETGYSASPLDTEVQGARGLPLLLSLLNASIPFKHWVYQGGRVWERSLPSQALFAALARAIPWRVWLWGSARLLDRARRQCLRGHGTGLRLARALLCFDGLVPLKGRSLRVVVDGGATQLPAFAGITSPYAAFVALGALELTEENLSTRADQALRCTADFLVRERLRCAITCALSLVARHVHARLRDQGLDPQVLERITLADLKANTLASNPALVLAEMDARDAHDAPAVMADTARIHIDSADAIAAHAHTLQGRVIVRARSAWMGLFSLAQHVARFEIDAPLAANSHFVQRARLLGIEVAGGLASPSSSGTSA